MWVGESTCRIPQSSWGITLTERRQLDDLEGVQRQARRTIKVLEDMTHGKIDAPNYLRISTACQRDD